MFGYQLLLQHWNRNNGFGNTENSLLGFIFGITSSIGFSVFSVTLRWRKETPKFTTVAFAGFFVLFLQQ